MRLLMYYDGKDHSKSALQTVIDRAKALKAKVHVLSSVSSWGEPSVKTIHDIRNGLYYVRDVLNKDNIPCYTHLRIRLCNPGEDIVDIANKYNIDEIIIGTSKESKVAKYRHGWFINHVLDWAKCPVLLV